MKYKINSIMVKNVKIKVTSFLELLRWNKPTGRMILLIPAGWSLYLTPESNPSLYMLLKIKELNKPF